jgi:hypothetical protein
MKIKKTGKKLTLNKNTVAHLDNGELNAIQGGDGFTKVGLSCLYCPITTDAYTCVTCRTGLSICDACLETEPISACC